MSDVKYFENLVPVTPGVITNAKIMAMQSDPKGAAGWKPTMLQLKDFFGEGQESFDATVGAVGSGADYNLVQDAIDALKVNLLVIGDYTNSETVVLGANFISITIAKKWTMNEGYVTIGAGGLKIQGGVLEGIYTITANKMFLSSASCTLQMHNLSGFMISSTIANAGIADLTSGSKHIISNCNFALSNTAECGFKNAGSSSSFTNLNVIGGGAACEGFIPDAKGAIISDINISGTVKDVSTFISSSTTPCVINSIRFTGTNRPIISLGVDANQVDNINGGIEIDPTDTSINQISNCYVADIDLTDASATQNKFSNCYVTTVNTTIAGVFNQFINFESDANLIVDGGANFFTHSRCPDVTVNGDANQFINASFTVYTDNGNDNAYISEVSEDETLSADSNRLLCSQKAIKTYADNIAKGITVDYYFSNTPDGVIANYDIMFPADTGEAQSTAAAALPAADTLIQTFITQTTEPNFTTLLAGIYDIHIHAAKTAGTKDAFIYAEFYKRTHPGGVETLLATSDNSALLTGSNVGYTLHFSLLNDEILDATDRLVVKFYGSPSGVGTDPTVTLYLEGTNSSRIDIHTTSSSWMLNLQNVIYRNGAGNDANDGKNMGTPKLTLASAITAAIAQSPSASNMITIKDLGGARVDEDITLPSWCILDTCDAHIIGQVTLGVTMSADSHFYFNKASPEAGSQCIRISGAGTRYIRGNSTGAALNSTFIVADGGAVVYLDIVNANSVAAGANFYTLATGAVLFLKAQTFRETVASTSVASTVFRNIVDDGTNADTSNINTTGDQIIRGKDKVTLGTSVADVLELNGSYQKWIVSPHFIAYKNAEATNATGDGTLYDIAMSQVDANIGSHYNTGTGVFTAPVTGLYHFNIVLFLDNLTGSHNDLNIRLNTTSSTWWLVQVDPGNVRSVSNELILNGSIDVLMTASNTAKFQVQVSGLTKTVHVQIASHCSGRLITRT